MLAIPGNQISFDEGTMTPEVQHFGDTPDDTEFFKELSISF